VKILLIGNSKTVFAKELQSELVERGRDVSLLDFEYLELYDKNGVENNRFSKKFLKYKNLPKIHMIFRMMIIKKVIKDYDIINIHVARWYYAVIAKSLMDKNVIVSFYGSDFYRATFGSKRFLNSLLKIAKQITFTNEKTRSDFVKNNIELEEKTKVCRFGLKTLDFIDKNRNRSKIDIKKELGYSISKAIITCGYNSTPAQQHEKIIENILKLPSSMLDSMQFIFPMTYGDGNYKKKIKNILHNTHLDYIVLEDFLYSDKNAHIKLASDIMINVLTTDSFSGSMQEFLYANNIVITGSWLPYDTFDELGIVYQKIDSIDELRLLLHNIIIDIDKYKIGLDKNIDIISKLSSWKYNIEDWIEVLN